MQSSRSLLWVGAALTAAAAVASGVAIWRVAAGDRVAPAVLVAVALALVIVQFALLAAVLRRSRDSEAALAAQLAERDVAAAGHRAGMARQQKAALQARSMAELAQAVLADPTLDGLLERSTELLAATLDAERALVLQVSADGRRLELRAGQGWPRQLGGELDIATGSAAGVALLADATLVLDRLDAEPRMRDAALLLGAGAVTGASAVIRVGTTPWGVLGAYRDRAVPFDADDIGFLESMTLLLSTAVRHAADQRFQRHQQIRLRAVWDATADGHLIVDGRGTIESANPAAARLFGQGEAELLGRGLGELIAETHRGLLDELLAAYRATGRSPVAETASDVRGLRGDGSVFPMEFAISEIVLEDRRHFVATCRDLTERRAAEDQLRQAQKMEAVGELTGGIAHDFNNLLTVVLGNSEILADELAADPRLRAIAETTRMAAQRGAELTRRLLAFSRRQALQPLEVDLNKLVLDVEKLLRRTLGEHIEIETVLHAGLWRANVDPGQLEAALLNLAINARDAMPDGGKLTIETANARLDDHYAAAHAEVTPGQYVVVSVTDTGTGMANEVRDRAFEPFFTTKEVGQGSGLGLSMVYGFVKQSGGHVKIYSELGQGTAVKIYLPRAVAGPVRGTPARPLHERIPAGNETILVVEDDTLVRAYVTEQLRNLGYSVHEAEGGRQALDVLAQLERVDLLLTDIVMPGGMNGRQLAERAQALRPGLRVLYTSGYSENAIIHHGRLDRGVHLLNKPFRKIELARKVRAVLDEARGETPG